MTTASSTSESIFVDTNVLVYATVATSPFHRHAISTLQNIYDRPAELWISRQVMREYLAVLSRPQTFTSPVAVSTLVNDLSRFEQQFRVAEDNDRVMRQLLELITSLVIGGKQVHDANIVATMLTYGIKTLLTHNTTDFARFASVITVIPLKS